MLVLQLSPTLLHSPTVTINVCKYENQIVKIGSDHRWLFVRLLSFFSSLTFPLFSYLFLHCESVSAFPWVSYCKWCKLAFAVVYRQIVQCKQKCVMHIYRPACLFCAPHSIPLSSFPSQQKPNQIPNVIMQFVEKSVEYQQALEIRWKEWKKTRSKLKREKQHHSSPVEHMLCNVRKFSDVRDCFVCVFLCQRRCCCCCWYYVRLSSFMKMHCSSSERAHAFQPPTQAALHISTLRCAPSQPLNRGFLFILGAHICRVRTRIFCFRAFLCLPLHFFHDWFQ